MNFSTKNSRWLNAVNSESREVHCGQNGSFQIPKLDGARNLILCLEGLNDVHI